MKACGAVNPLVAVYFDLNCIDSDRHLYYYISHHACTAKTKDHTNLYTVGCLSCTGTLIPIIVLVIQLIIDTISNLPVYEIQLLHEFDNTHGTSGTCKYACLLFTNWL